MFEGYEIVFDNVTALGTFIAGEYKAEKIIKDSKQVCA